jgi:hypothetical protein
VGSRIAFYVLALVVFPPIGLLVSNYGIAYGSDVLAWLSLLGLPAALTILTGRYANRATVEIAALAVASSALAFGEIMLLLVLAARSGGLS